MAARFGYVLYYFICLIAALWFGVTFHNLGWTTDIDDMRRVGYSDAEILEHVKKTRVGLLGFEKMKPGVNISEMLTEIRDLPYPKISGQKVRSITTDSIEWVVILGGTFAIWLLGAALRYIFAGNVFGRPRAFDPQPAHRSVPQVQKTRSPW